MLAFVVGVIALTLILFFFWSIGYAITWIFWPHFHSIRYPFDFVMEILMGVAIVILLSLAYSIGTAMME